MFNFFQNIEEKKPEKDKNVGSENSDSKSEDKKFEVFNFQDAQKTF